jgi:ketosteroid isomerase-like protein
VEKFIDKAPTSQVASSTIVSTPSHQTTRMLKQTHTRKFCQFLQRIGFVLVPFLIVGMVRLSFAGDDSSPEAVVRKLVKANADKDLAAMAKHMSHDVDAIGYSIGGRKYVGWEPFADEMRSEFNSVAKLEIPILDLKVWSRGDVAWFVMELDYIRHVAMHGLKEASNQRMVIPLRETGVLERRDGRWILVSWHESARQEGALSHSDTSRQFRHRTSDGTSLSDASPNYDLSGEWEILEIEDNKTYRATLDRQGNGPYTWQGGQFTTTAFNDRRWHGTWKQTGNDREGGFELVLSEDGTQAKGIWWYVRVGNKDNIPPRQHGGSYVWKRLTSPPPSTQQ